MIKKIIFDLDNTLILWKDEYVNALKETLKKYNINEDPNYVNNLIDGKCRSVVYRRCASVVGDGKKTIKQLVDKKNCEPWHGVLKNHMVLDEPAVTYPRLGSWLKSIIYSNHIQNSPFHRSMSLW